VTSENLPKWFPLRRKSGEISLEEMLHVAKQRIDFLFAYKEIDNPNDIGHDPTIGNISLCIVSAISNDAYFSRWLAETEGDAFEYLLNKSSYEEQISIIRFLFENVIIGLPNISDIINLDSDFILRELSAIKKIRKSDMYQVASTFVEYNIVASRFKYAYRIIKRGAGLIIKGWVITSYIELLKTAKWIFQRRVEEKIKKIKAKMEESMGDMEAYGIFAKEVLSYWRSKKTALMPQKFSTILFGKNYGKKVNYFPPVREYYLISSWQQDIFLMGIGCS